ncbi:MAG: Fe-S cluster assembly protein SufD [Cyclobacteriaceae bacterium]|nr:Fe-S cluster assembly protein SufD [Cyclobacteriaceae bacterium]
MPTATKNMELSLNQVLKDLFEKHQKQNNGAPAAYAEQAFERFMKTGFPDRKSEEYKYFPVHRHFPESPLLAEKVEDPGAHLVFSPKLDDREAIHLVFIDGRLSEKHSSRDLPEAGLEIKHLNQLSSTELRELLEDHLDTYNVNNDPFIELNSSFLRDGIFIKTSKKSSTLPVYCYYITSAEDVNSFRNFRTIMVLEQDSRAELAEYFFSEENAGGFENFFTEVYAGKGSRLNLYRIQHKRGKEVLLNNINIYQKENSLVNSFTFSLSGKMLRNNLNFLLEEENCESHLYGFYFVDGDDVIDNHTTVDHQKPNCFSNENYKGILDKNGKGIFNGKIYVRQNAQKTNAFQSNKNIVLTDSATINTKPQLEIWADDVKCSHGATTGQLDNHQLFYLRSRGLDERTAKALLLHAFAFEIIDKIELDPVKDYLTKVINKLLGYQFDN